MEFMVIFFLAAFAIGNAQDCSEERAEACVSDLLAALLGDTAEEEVCGELKTAIDCLREAAQECIAEVDMEELEEGLTALEKLLKENCEEEQSQQESEQESEDGEESEEEKEMQKCFDANEDYVYECIADGTAEALSVLLEKGETDENALQCMMYSMMAECFTERIEEKCGRDAADLARKELLDAPEEIKQACEAAETNLIEDFQQLADKKRRK